jgi:hypothetical protein
MGSLSVLFSLAARSLFAAVDLAPHNSRYLAGPAALQPEQSPALLMRALTLNECNDRSWVQLGLDAEFQQADLVLAERYYHRAAEVNHMFYPASNLANFYFCYQRRNEFFEWAHRSLQMAYADPALLFAEIWSLSEDPKFNESLLPERVRVFAPYVSFLIQPIVSMKLQMPFAAC